jgi:hypothetical protein
MFSTWVRIDSGYLARQSGAGPTGGTTIAIVSNATVIPYINSTSQSPTNSPCWQMYYANQSVTFSQIIQYTYTNGSNSWQWYISKAPSSNSQNFAGATVTSIGSQSASYTSGGTTTSNVTSQTVPAGYYFLVGCVSGPYYKTFNAAANNYIFTSGGVAKVTMINKTYWRNHGAVDQTMTIPTQLGGSGTYNAPSQTIWCLNLGNIS